MISQMAYWHSDTEVIDTFENTTILDREPKVRWDRYGLAVPRLLDEFDPAG